MPLKPGTINNYNASMAEAMELAFSANWKSVMGNDVPIPPSNNQMKLMFIAIANGVVNHLNSNASSFEVVTTIDGTVNKTHGAVSNILTNP